MYEEAKRESEKEQTQLEHHKHTEAKETPEISTKNTQTKTEAWRKVKSPSQTLLESGAGGVKPSGGGGVKPAIKETPGVKSPNPHPAKTGKDSPRTAQSVPSSPEKKGQQEAESPVSRQRQPQRQLTTHRFIQPAASTNNIAGERKSPLNVKRVSSSGDMTGGARQSPRVSTAGPGRGGGGFPRNQVGGRRLSDNVGGSKERGGEPVVVGEVGRPKQQRVSVPTSEKIRLPSARGDKVLPTLPKEVTGSRSGVNQTAVDRSSSANPKTKQSAKHHSLMESSPYAVSV